MPGQPSGSESRQCCSANGRSGADAVSARDPLVAFSRITPIEWEDLRHTIGFLEGLDSERGIAWGLLTR